MSFILRLFERNEYQALVWIQNQNTGSHSPLHKNLRPDYLGKLGILNRSIAGQVEKTDEISAN